MGKDKRSDKTPAPRLSDEDARLWEQVAGTAKPLSKGKDRNLNLPNLPEPPGSEPAAQETDKKTRPPRASDTASSEKPKPASPPPLGAYDRGELRGLAGGRIALEGRIDLHGMRQREAHTALRAFLQKSQARGHRHVLVITGKGTRVSDDGVERGVLNREVPRWLSEPEFRQTVVGFAPAHKRHGGEGALYVRLRKTRQS